MLVLTDSNWQKAKARAVAIGLSEEDERFEQYVRSAYESERLRGHILYKADPAYLVKAVNAEPKSHVVKKKPSEGQPVVGGWASGQRPDQRSLVHGRVVAVGKHGVMIKDDKKRLHKVRHEHVAEHQAPINEKEWAKASQALLGMGIAVDPVSRFTKPDKKVRPDRKSQQRLKRMGKKHKMLDAKRALKEGSVGDVERLIDHYGKKTLKKSVPIIDPNCTALGGPTSHRSRDAICAQRDGMNSAGAIICRSGHSHPIPVNSNHARTLANARIRCDDPIGHGFGIRNHSVYTHGLAMVRDYGDAVEMTSPRRPTPEQTKEMGTWTRGHYVEQAKVYPG